MSNKPLNVERELPHMGGGYGKYGKHPCVCCGKWISQNGLGYNAHMMTHVRSGTMYRERGEDGLWRYYMKGNHRS